MGKTRIAGRLEHENMDYCGNANGMCGNRKVWKPLSKALALLLIILMLLTSLTACWDKIEIENRAFVVAIAVDVTEDASLDVPGKKAICYTVTLSLPAANDSKEDEGEDAPPHVVSGSALTLSEAIKKIDAETKSPLYFGQAKLLALGGALLEEPEMLRVALDYFNRHPEIDRTMYVVASHENASDILKSAPQGDSRPGRYIAAMYRDKQKLGGASFPLSLDDLVTQVKYHDAVLVPIIKADEEKLQFNGAMLLDGKRKSQGKSSGRNRGSGESSGRNRGSDESKSQATGKNHTATIDNTRHLDEDELRGYLWCKPEGCLGTVVTVTEETTAKKTRTTTSHNANNQGIQTGFEPQHIPFKVETHAVTIRFKESNDRVTIQVLTKMTPESKAKKHEKTVPGLEAHIYVELTGRIEEIPGGYEQLERESNRQYIAAQIEAVVQEEILKTASKMQDELILDGHNLLEIMRKKQYGLYQRHAEHWHDIFPSVKIVPQVHVVIKT